LIKVFGSFVKGNFNSNSDIDLIVNFSDRKSLIDLARIEDELENSTSCKIDLLTENSNSPYILERVNREAKTIYEKS
jgi:predicted nucleotidyltransferase